MEEWLDAHAGPGVIDGIAERAVLDKRYVKGAYDRLLAAAFMIRVIVLQTLMPEAQLSDVIIALAGDLALVPWSGRWQPASERACLDWRRALGPAPLEELQDTVLAAAQDEHAERAAQSLTIGKEHPLTACSADGSALRVPGTPENRAEYGSVGTADDSSAWPSVRLYPLSNCLTRSLLAMPRGPAGSDKTASEQWLLDAAMRDFPHVLAKDQADRETPGRHRPEPAPRPQVQVRHEAHCYIARLAGRDERRISLDLMADRNPKGRKGK
jgi:hypothetical protein